MKKGFATAVFAGLAVLLMAYVASTAVLLSSVQSHSNDLLSVNHAHERLQDAGGVANRSMDHAILQMAYTFGCSADPGNPFARANFCFNTIPNGLIEEFETTALSLLNDSIASVEWTSVSPSCTDVSSTFEISHKVTITANSSAAVASQQFTFVKKLTVVKNGVPAKVTITLDYGASAPAIIGPVGCT